MTALSKYQRLEAAGLWRPDEQTQRRDVIVSVGDATLVITDTRDNALAHWSLAAVKRANPGIRPAIYHPDGDPAETLELAESETVMIDAIEKLRGAIESSRPHPGRLRLVSFLLSVAAVGTLAIFWLPGALRDYALGVVPQVNRGEIGNGLLRHIEALAGTPCRLPEADAALERLATRLPGPDGPGVLTVLRNGVSKAVHLPGGRILLSHTLVEDHDNPDILAGYIIAERLRAQLRDPLSDLLDFGGLDASIRLLATGEIAQDLLKAYARRLLTMDPHPVPDPVMLAGFQTWQVRATPYAYARDITGESTLALIEADPFADGAPEPVLSDADWLRLQAICGG